NGIPACRSQVEVRTYALSKPWDRVHSALERNNVVHNYEEQDRQFWNQPVAKTPQHGDRVVHARQLLGFEKACVFDVRHNRAKARFQKKLAEQQDWNGDEHPGMNT